MEFFLSLAGLLVLAVALAQLCMWVDRWQIEYKKEKYEANRQRRYKRYSHVKGAEGRAIAANIHALSNQFFDQSNQQSRQDQERASRENRNLVALIAAGAIAFGSDILLYRQLQDARAVANGQHTDTMKVLSLTVRPWVSLTDEDDAFQATQIQFDEGSNVAIQFSIFTKNYSGSAAAQNVIGFF